MKRVNEIHLLRNTVVSRWKHCYGQRRIKWVYQNNLSHIECVQVGIKYVQHFRQMLPLPYFRDGQVKKCKKMFFYNYEFCFTLPFVLFSVCSFFVHIPCILSFILSFSFSPHTHILVSSHIRVASSSCIIFSCHLNYFLSGDFRRIVEERWLKGVGEISSEETVFTNLITDKILDHVKAKISKL